MLSNAHHLATQGKLLRRSFAQGSASQKSYSSVSRVSQNEKNINVSATSYIAAPIGTGLVSKTRSVATTTPISTHQRSIHTTTASLKKKEMNVKALGTQGRRKEKGTGDEDAAELKLVEKPAPAVLAKRAAEAAAASAAKTSVVSEEAEVVDPKQIPLSQLPPEVVSVSPEVALDQKRFQGVAKHLKQKYPAMYNLIRYESSRMGKAELWDRVLKSMKTEELKKDPVIGGYLKWMDRLTGQGDIEDRLTYKFRLANVKRRMELAEVWKEADAELAQMRSQRESVEVLLGKDEPLDQQLLDEIGDPELAEIINQNPGDDEDMQRVMSFLGNPHPNHEHDLDGVLEGSLLKNDYTEMDILGLRDARAKDLHTLFNPDVDIAASLRTLDCSDEVIERVMSKPPTNPQLRAEWESLVKQVEKKAAAAREAGLPAPPPSWPDLLTNRNIYGGAFADRDPRELDLERLKKMATRDPSLSDRRQMNELAKKYTADDLAAMSSGQTLEEWNDDELDEGSEQFKDPTDPDTALILKELLEALRENADTEEYEEAFHPLYAEKVVRELPKEDVAKFYPSAERQAALEEQYKADLELLMNPEKGEEAMSAEDKAMFALDPVNLMKAITKISGIPDLTLRQKTRTIMENKLIEMYEAVTLKEYRHDGATDMASVLRNLTKVPGLRHLRHEESMAPVFEQLTQLYDNGMGPPSPLGNPMTQWEDTEYALQVTKDIALDEHAELVEHDGRLAEVMARAKASMIRDLRQPEAPEWIKTLDNMQSRLFGSPVSSIEDTIDGDEYMAEFSDMLRENMILSRAKTSMERETASIHGLVKEQFSGLLDTAPTSSQDGYSDPGFYLSQATEEVEAELPVPQRLYVSSDTDVLTIFSEASIGKYLTLTDRDMKKYLPEGVSRRLASQEFEGVKNKSLLIRTQALQAIDNLKAQHANSFIVPVDAHKTDSARPMILYGYTGCGKSAILSQVVYWARRSDWFVVNVSDGVKWLEDSLYISKNPVTGTWDTPKRMVKFFNHLLDAHSEKLKQIPLKRPVTIGKLDAKTLFDVAEYGSVLEQYAAQCFLSFRAELQLIVEFPVLVVYDSYNALYNPSSWKDPESQAYHKLPLTADRLTIGNFFVDAHLNPKLAYGTFLGALSEAAPIRNFVQYVPDKNKGLKLVEPKYLEVPPYSMQEFSTVMEHYKHHNWIRTEMSRGSASELYIYQLTSGFGEAVWSYTKKL